jgi:hypothetical protein
MTAFEKLNKLMDNRQWKKTDLDAAINAALDGKEVAITATLNNTFPNGTTTTNGAWWATSLDTMNAFNAGGGYCRNLLTDDGKFIEDEEGARQSFKKFYGGCAITAYVEA